MQAALLLLSVILLPLGDSAGLLQPRGGAVASTQKRGKPVNRFRPTNQPKGAASGNAQRISISTSSFSGTSLELDDDSENFELDDDISDNLSLYTNQTNTYVDSIKRRNIKRGSSASTVIEESVVVDKAWGQLATDQSYGALKGRDTSIDKSKRTRIRALQESTPAAKAMIQTYNNDDVKFTDPMFIPDSSRFALFPIKSQSMWEMYKKHVASFWTVEEVDLGMDMHDWCNKLSDDERHFIQMVLAFFAGRYSYTVHTYILYIFN